MGRVAVVTNVERWQQHAMRNAMFSVAAQVASKLSTFAWTVVAAHQLTQRSFGEFNFALSLGLLLAAAAEWGFDTALVQRASRDTTQVNRLFSLALACEALVAIPLFLIAGAVAVGTIHGSSARNALVLVLAATLLDAFSDTVRAVATALQRQGGVSLALTLGRLITALLAIPLLALGAGLVGLATALAVSSALGLAAHAVAAARLGVELQFGGLNAAALRGFVSGTAAFGISGLVLAALFRFDTILVAALKDERAVGAYSAAYKLFDTVLFATFAVTGALFPAMSAVGDEPRRVGRTLRGGLVVLMAFYAPFTVLCLLDPHEVLRVLFGNVYSQQSATALRWLAPAPVIFAVGYLVGAALAAVRETRGLLVAAVSATAINIAGDLVAISLFSVSGAAFMTTVGYATEALLLLGYARRHDVRGLGPWPTYIPTAVATAAFALSLLALPLPAGGAIVLGAAVYTAVWLVVTRWTQPEQLALVTGLLTRRQP